MDTTKVAKVVELVLKSCITSCTAGESIEDTRGLVMLGMLSSHGGGGLAWWNLFGGLTQGS